MFGEPSGRITLLRKLGRARRTSAHKSYHRCWAWCLQSQPFLTPNIMYIPTSVYTHNPLNLSTSQLGTRSLPLTSAAAFSTSLGTGKYSGPPPNPFVQKKGTLLIGTNNMRI